MILSIIIFIAITIVFIKLTNIMDDNENLSISKAKGIISYFLVSITMGISFGSTLYGHSEWYTMCITAVIPFLIMLGFFSNIFILHSIGLGVAIVSLCSLVSSAIIGWPGALIGIAIGYGLEFGLEKLIMMSAKSTTWDDFQKRYLTE